MRPTGKESLRWSVRDPQADPHSQPLEETNRLPGCSFLIPSFSPPCPHQWILRPEYLLASQKAGRFLEEAEYEWGARGEETPLVWGGACRRWREAFEAERRWLDGWQVSRPS